MPRHRLTAAGVVLEVDPQDGGRWSSLQVDGLELLTSVTVGGVPRGVQHGCFVMAPYAGRVGRGRLVVDGTPHDLPRDAPPHAIHGHVFDVPWDVEGEGVLSARLGSPWPFPGSVRQELVLRSDRLDVRLSLQAEEAMPATIGFHPWFARRLSRGSKAQLRMSPRWQYEKGPDELPTGELVAPGEGPYDDCFTGMAEPPTLVWPGALELTMTSSADHWVVFDEHPHALCLEPQTGPPDAVALGRAALVPSGGELVLEVSLRWG